MDGMKKGLNDARAKASTGAGAGGEGGAGGPQPPTFLAPLITAVGGLGILGYGAYKSVVVVQPGHLGIVYNRWGGLNDKGSLNEGLNFVIPWFQRAVMYDCRIRSQVVNTSSGSKDLQMVAISLRVVFKPNPDEIATIYRTLGKDYDARVLPSIVNEITKSVVAQYNASELLTKRDQVSRMIKSMLVQRAKDFQIIVDEVSIPHLEFSKDYTAAVEAKQVAQQDAERAKYIVVKALEEKKAIVIKAEGEARSAELIGSAIRENPAFITLRRIEAAREVAATICRSNNKVYLNSDSLMLNSLGDVTPEPPRKTGWFSWLW